MYRIDGFSDDSIFQIGFNNYALKSLIEFCNIENKQGENILEDYVGSRKLVIGCEKSYIDEICNIIMKNKTLLINAINEEYNLNTERVLSDDMIIVSIIDAIQLTADDKYLTVPEMNVEYIIANAIISNDESAKHMFYDIKDKGNLSEAIEVSLSRFFDTGAEIDELMSEIFETYCDDVSDDYAELELAELLEDSFYGIELILQVFYDFDYELIDSDPEIAKSLLNVESLDDLLKTKTMRDNKDLEIKTLCSDQEIR